MVLEVVAQERVVGETIVRLGAEREQLGAPQQDDVLLAGKDGLLGQQGPLGGRAELLDTLFDGGRLRPCRTLYNTQEASSKRHNPTSHYHSSAPRPLVLPSTTKHPLPKLSKLFAL